MSNFISYVILGVPYGCLFALVAIGLVLTYKTAGVFNLAFGAQAFLSAAVYYDVRQRAGWPLVPAALFAIVVVGPAVGLLLDRAIFRHMRSAPAVARLVAALGLLVAVPQMVQLWLVPTVQTKPLVGIWWNDNALYHVGSYVLDGRQMGVLASTAIAVVALGALFRWSNLGLQMRAVVESPRLTELAGVDAGRVGSAAWMLSSLFAALAGVLLAPFSASLNSNDYTVLLVAAIAAAAFGKLTSIPLALVGGILLGVAQNLLKGYLPPASTIARGLQPALPFLVLVLLLLFLPGLRRTRDVIDPLAGVDPPPQGLASTQRGVLLTRLTHGAGVVFVGVMIALVLTTFDGYWVGLLTQGVIYSVIFLSITVITGMAGQVSLCQATFAGVGAFTTAQLATALGMPVVFTILLGALLAAAVGALVAIPALRLGGIFLALGTLAFALLFDNVLVPQGWVGGGTAILRVPRPLIGPFNLSSDRSYFLFCVVVLAIVSVIVILVRGGTTGRYLDALRGSEVAARSLGIDPARARILAFALSAGIAGLGGGLLATQVGLAQPEHYSYFFGLFFVVIVVTVGARTVEGAVNAGLSLVLLPEILKLVGLAGGWEYILFGLGAITYAKNPQGVLEPQKAVALAFVQRVFDRFRVGVAAPATVVAPAGAAAGSGVASPSGSTASPPPSSPPSSRSASAAGSGP